MEYMRRSVRPDIKSDQLLIRVSDCPIGLADRARLAENVETRGGTVRAAIASRRHSLRSASLRTTSRLLLLPVGQVDRCANGLSPSLRGNYPDSPILQDSPPVPGGSVSSASRRYRFCLLLLRRPTDSQVPCQSQDYSHATCTQDTAWPVTQFSPCSSRRAGALRS